MKFRVNCTYGGVAVPQIGVDLGDGLAGVGVDELDVHEQGDTLLVLGNVLADELTGNVLWVLARTLRSWVGFSAYSKVPGSHRGQECK